MPNNTTFNISIEMAPAIKLACYQAIILYCRDCGVNTTELNKLVETNDITNDKILALSNGIKKAEEISNERKDNISDLISIITEINFSAASLFLQIIKYLEKIPTGWWIFTTGNSRLKDHFNVVFNKFDAVAHDTEIINQLKAQKDFRIVPTNTETAAQLKDDQEKTNCLDSLITSYQKRIDELEALLEEKDEKITCLLKENKRLLENNMSDSYIHSLHDSLEIEIKKFQQVKPFIKEQVFPEKIDVNYTIIPYL